MIRLMICFALIFSATTSYAVELCNEPKPFNWSNEYKFYHGNLVFIGGCTFGPSIELPSYTKYTLVLKEN